MAAILQSIGWRELLARTARFAGWPRRNGVLPAAQDLRATSDELGRCREALFEFGRESDEEFTALAMVRGRFGG